MNSKESTQLLQFACEIALEAGDIMSTYFDATGEQIEKKAYYMLFRSMV